YGQRESADVGYESPCLLFADFPALGWHVLSLAVEDARHQLRVGSPRLPLGIGEVGDVGEAVARPTPCAIRPLALHAEPAGKLSDSGGCRCRRSRLLWRGALHSLGGSG